MGLPTYLLDAIASEALLFAAVGMLVGGVDEMIVDILYLVVRLRRRTGRPIPLAQLGSGTDGVHVIFVPAWDERTVIGAMLRTTLSRLTDPCLQVYVGLYPNDPGTRAAVEAIARSDARVRPVIGPRAGPTTKADCLNVLWHALVADDPQHRSRTVIVHDAEDVVHPDELAVFDALIGRYAAVQLPVLPLVERGANLIAGTYRDEFAEAHGRTMLVRASVGAGLPLAGTGCAIAADMLARLADERGGDPFDAESLVEDYELGLRIAALGGRGIFARVADKAGGLIAVRAIFPAKFGRAVRQKARWIAGIALAGWDRTGWTPRRLALADHWMRLRDRRAPIAATVLAAAYVGALAWVAAAGLHALAGTPSPPLPLGGLLVLNGLLLVWRLVARAAFTAAAYGAREAVWSVPRMFVGNFITLAAVCVALQRYVGMLRGRPIRWGKTEHHFPTADAPPAPAA